MGSKLGYRTKVGGCKHLPFFIKHSEYFLKRSSPIVKRSTSLNAVHPFFFPQQAYLDSF